MEAVLAESNRHSENHPARDSNVARSPVLRKIYSEYRYLKTLSNDARYRVKSFGEAELKLVQTKFSAIKKHIDRTLR